MRTEIRQAFYLFAFICLPAVAHASELDHVLGGAIELWGLLLAGLVVIVVLMSGIAHYAKAFIWPKSASLTDVYVRALIILAVYAAIGIGIYNMLR